MAAKAWQLLTLTTRRRSLALNICQRCYCVRPALSNEEVRKKRNALFTEEKKRQMAAVQRRTEKIEVQHVGVPEDCTLVMNKGVSTPFNCAMHIQELLMTRSALALVNGEPWDMHRPLVSDCELQFLHFLDEDPQIVNDTFWRTCSFILGHIMETSIKDKFYVELCSSPTPNVRSGSFLYDMKLNVDKWKPSTVELNILGRQGANLFHQDLRFERLDVSEPLAAQIFDDNSFKSRKIPTIAGDSDGRITLYRMGDHVDMSSGPLLSSTDHIGRFNISAFHTIESSDFGPLTRVQGLALPVSVKMHYWSYDILMKRAAKLNPAPGPSILGQTPPGAALLDAH